MKLNALLFCSLTLAFPFCNAAETKITLPITEAVEARLHIPDAQRLKAYLHKQHVYVHDADLEPLAGKSFGPEKGAQEIEKFLSTYFERNYNDTFHQNTQVRYYKYLLLQLVITNKLVSEDQRKAHLAALEELTIKGIYERVDGSIEGSGCSVS